MDTESKFLEEARRTLTASVAEDGDHGLRDCDVVLVLESESRPLRYGGRATDGAAKRQRKEKSDHAYIMILTLLVGRRLHESAFNVNKDSYKRCRESNTTVQETSFAFIAIRGRQVHRNNTKKAGKE